ncbi:hypothetical protein PQX77_016263 [Marasmius sp. AFHP31]|nr:hypothetical protein PQX77_016263 [Marasmius sp. AFHP31]
MSSTSVIEEGYKTDKTSTTINNLESYSSHWTEWERRRRQRTRTFTTTLRRRQMSATTPSPLLVPRKITPPRRSTTGCLNNNNLSSSPPLIPTMTSPADLSHTRSSTSPHYNSTNFTENSSSGPSTLTRFLSPMPNPTRGTQTTRIVVEEFAARTSFSRQNPSFIGAVLNLKPTSTREKQRGTVSPERPSGDSHLQTQVYLLSSGLALK